MVIILECLFIYFFYKHVNKLISLVGVFLLFIAVKTFLLFCTNLLIRNRFIQLYYTENCLELVVTIPTPRDCWIRIETFRMSPRMRQPEISRGSQSDYSTPRLAAAVGTLGNFFRKTFAWPPDFGKKLSSLVPITNSSESSCQTQKHPRHDCRWQSRGSMDWWSGALHGRVVSPGDLIPLTFT